jgi:hypothetical protein
VTRPTRRRAHTRPTTLPFIFSATFLLVGALCLMLFPDIQGHDGSAVGAELAGTAQVIDGDTISLAGARIRLWGYRCPRAGANLQREERRHLRMWSRRGRGAQRADTWSEGELLRTGSRPIWPDCRGVPDRSGRIERGDGAARLGRRLRPLQRRKIQIRGTASAPRWAGYLGWAVRAALGMAASALRLLSPPSPSALTKQFGSRTRVIGPVRRSGCRRGAGKAAPVQAWSGRARRSNPIGSG